MSTRLNKALTEAGGLIRAPHRVFPLIGKITHDKWRTAIDQRHLYSYVKTDRTTERTLSSLIKWIINAQRADGGIAAYYSLLTGYSASYPEVTGYLIPTLYDFAQATGDHSALYAAECATQWLLSLQLNSGGFPAGLQGSGDAPSVFNTGQILQGLARAWVGTGRSDIRNAALAAGDWLVSMQGADGAWSGPGAYQGTAHTYYTMVAWALAQLAEISGDEKYGLAAERNMDWALAHLRPNGWPEGLNLQGHPNYLHFVAYAIQGVLETAILRRRPEAIQTISKPAWLLLRKFETSKRLPGTFDRDFTPAHNFACLTGNAQMSCVWLRLFAVNHDLRYLNAALKMNELLKEFVPARGPRGIVGGVSGSYPIWGAYQPMRYISWGCKFSADALMLERRLMRDLEVPACAS
jgi:hypothetical protein